MACLGFGREVGNTAVILHLTKAMQITWGMYGLLGFARSEELDFVEQEQLVYGIRLQFER